MIYSVQFLICFEFFKIGLFTFGGGLASLPFLYEIMDKYHWFNEFQLSQLIAISNLTPGPIGLNMATYCGYNILNIKGALLSSFSLILPMLVITSFVFKLYKKFFENKLSNKILYILRPTSCALILAVGVKLFYNLIINKGNIDYLGLTLLLVLFLLTFKIKKDPLIYIFISAVFGFIVYCIKSF